MTTDLTTSYTEMRRKNAQLRADLDEVRADREHLTRLLDEFAAAVAPADVIGEHTPFNDPWRNALDLITPMAEVHALREENARLRRENDALTVGCGIPDDLDDDALDDLLRTTGDRVLRQLNDVLDVDAGLSEILTRHEGEL